MHKITRRDFLNLTKVLVYLLGAKTTLNWLWRMKFEEIEETRPDKLGTTFSQIQCDYLGLNRQETFREISSLGIDYIRLCVYWNEIESKEGQFDFSMIDWLIDECQKRSIDIVLAVGMKVPRWPEFHFPKWVEKKYINSKAGHPLDANEGLAEASLEFVERVICHTQNVPITYWQVENEALSKLEVAAGRYLSYEFLRREVNMVRKYRPNQKILLTNSINLLPLSNGDQRAFEMSLQIADAIGVNVYTKVPKSRSGYFEDSPYFWKKLISWQNKLEQEKKEAWIAESQAEPWEWNQLVVTSQLSNPSTSPEKATNLAIKLGQLGYKTVFLWGSEYWIWHKKQGSFEWVNAMSKLIGLPRQAKWV